MRPSRSVRRALAPCTLLAVALLAGPAAAQFDEFTWVYQGDPSGQATVDALSAHVQGPDAPQGCTVSGLASVVTTAPEPGWVFAHYAFENLDSGLGSWGAEDPVFVINGEITYVGPGDFYPGIWEGDVAFHVAAGQPFGFGVQSVDCLYGPGVLDVTAFVFVPDVWQDLGGALAGGNGTPTLMGSGPLAANTPWSLGVVDCATNAPAWLLLSSAVLDAPFKGGVLLPDPSVAVSVVANTGPNGRIFWSGTWPEGIPAGAPLVLQWWISDPTGPAGWAASNGVQRSTL